MSAPMVLADGTWIDYFRVQRRLGRGGFGVTYLAEEFREWEVGTTSGTPLRLVAIKEYFPRGLATRSDGQTVSMSADVEGAEQAFAMALKGFFTEAESLMRFDHPNVIKIHRVFQRNGTAYYVMPFLKGESLKAIIKRDGAMGEERARRLLLPVLDGLIHAHARGILHRDIKPDNVMIPDEGAPVLIDFGAARAQAVDDVQDYTRHSELVAYTPGYAALEQYGRATRDNPHGPQTDVYGLAAVMYHAVVGEAPPEASLRSMQLSNGAEDPMVPASSRLMDTPGYGRAFLAAIDWGLELASRNRPATLTEFRRALDGKLTLPDLTQARLEQHGVSTETFTRPGPTTRAVTMPLPTGDTQPLGAQGISAPADTIIAGLPSTTPTQPSIKPSANTVPLFPATAPPTATPTTHAERRGGGRALPLLGLLVSLLALAYVGRDHIPDELKQKLPPALLAMLEPEPREVAPPTPPPATPIIVEPAKPAEPTAILEDTKTLAEREAFEAAKTSDSLEGWKAFKRAFPKSALVATADIRIAALQPPKPAPTPTPKIETQPVAPTVQPAPVSAPAPAPVTQAAPSPKLLKGGFRDCPACPEMVRIVGGTFEMGDIAGSGEADELPLRKVTLGSFAAGRFEVTFDEWDACVAGGGCSGKPADGGWGRGRHPVINVSWNDAQRYVRWLSNETGKAYRLPSEAEFEFLNRAGSRAAFSWGDDGGAACGYANVADQQAKKRKPEWNTFPCDDGNAVTSTVGSYRSNGLGLFDVAGNVWEWTQDCYQSYREASNDGKAHNPPNCPRRVIRGGSWSDATRNLRVADRTASAPTATLNIVGFRVVRD